MAKIIIGIHGLSNKPEEKKLYKWWLQAINDGLSKVDCNALPQAQFKFAYWADLMYETPDPDPEPYTEPSTDEVDDDTSKIIDIGREFFSDIIGMFGDFKEQMSDSDRIEGIRNSVRRKIVEDLAAYYDDNSVIKFSDRKGVQTRAALRSVLKELIVQHKTDDLMVISHSMGSIIAYDVLRSLRDSDIKVEHFITIGSPLGIFNVKAKTHEEWDEKDGPFVPENLTGTWTNYSDRKDLVCADLTLAKEYKPVNGVEVKDILVSNGYCFTADGNKKHNHHKSYGYLRTQAFGKHLKAFLRS